MPQHTVKIGGLVEYTGSKKKVQNKIATVREHLGTTENPKYRIQFKETDEELTVREAEITPL